VGAEARSFTKWGARVRGVGKGKFFRPRAGDLKLTKRGKMVSQWASFSKKKQRRLIMVGPETVEVYKGKGEERVGEIRVRRRSPITVQVVQDEWENG